MLFRSVAVWRVLLDAYSAQRIVLDPVDIAAFREEFIEMNNALLLGASHQGVSGNRLIDHEDVDREEDGKCSSEFYSDPDGTWRSLVLDGDGVVIGERGGFDKLADAKAWATDLAEKTNRDNKKEGDHVDYG